MKKIKIDFVSDVACPWCAVGLGNLNQAIEQQIRECPSQYYWAYDRYKASRKALKKLGIYSKKAGD